MKTEVFYDTDFEFTGKNNELLIDMTKKLNCDTYLSNKGSENYVDIDMFTSNNLNHRYIDYRGVNYRQCFKEFVPLLSIVDMMFNMGNEKTYELLADDKNYTFSELNMKI